MMITVCRAMPRTSIASFDSRPRRAISCACGHERNYS